MVGIRDPMDLTILYCRHLLKEYTVLDSAQLLSILRRYGGMSYAARAKMIRNMCQRKFAQKISLGDRAYFISRPGIKIEGRIKQQIKCFWVLMDYLDKVDQHYASGTASSVISMEIKGRDYSILCVDKGKERACCYQMERGGATRYFVLVEDLSQIPLIKGEQIHAFAMLDERNTVHYYTN